MIGFGVFRPTPDPIVTDAATLTTWATACGGVVEQVGGVAVLRRGTWVAIAPLPIGEVAS